MSFSFAGWGFLFAAGVVAGIVGTAGGITSLVSYPALLIVGVPPLDASITNLVAAVPCLPGSMLASRRELRGTRSVLISLMPATLVGCLAGSVLLLTTPSPIFDRIVPFLVLIGSASIVAQPYLTRRFRHRDSRTLAIVLMTLVAVYSAYFGAGSGVMTLALLMVLVDERLPEANAVKNVLIGAGTVVSAVVFVVAGSVRWDAVAPLALGAFTGSLLGPGIGFLLSVLQRQPSLVQAVVAGVAASSSRG